MNEILHSTDEAQKMKIEGSDDTKLENNYCYRKKIKIEVLTKVIPGVCRVCLKDGTMNIFGNSDKDIANALLTFGGIEVLEKDGYPQYLCKPCFDVLQSAILFKYTAQKSDETLRQYNEKVMNADQMKDVVKKEVTTDHCNNDSLTSNVTDNTDLNNSHYRKRISKRRFCKKCELHFDDMQKYKNHIALKHKTKTTCQYCQKEFRIINITRHIETNHNPNKTFICHVCGEEMISAIRFTHIKKCHSRELRFECDDCPYKGKDKDLLRKHIQSHLKVKPYKCLYCQKSFVNNSNLSRHTMANHTKIKNFKCNVCERAFYFKRELDEHVKVDHSGIKNHICNVCFKAFGYRKQMTKHQLKVHKRDKVRRGRMPLYLSKEMQEKKDSQKSL